MHIRMFDPSIIHLLDEVHHYHPHIIHLCTMQADKDFYMQLCEVAAAIGLVVEGDFTDKDTYKLCEYLTKMLVASRAEVILPIQ